MHVSLDSALGRQRRLNSVGESVLQIAPSAAAAYSLRSLTGGDPKVVRVRRSSDNAESDFTASEVSSGALTSFVNENLGITFGTAEGTTNAATLTNASNTGFTYASSDTNLRGIRLPFSQSIPAGATISVTITTSNKTSGMTPSVKFASNSSSQLGNAADPTTLTSSSGGTQTFTAKITGTATSLAFFDNNSGSFDISNVVINSIVYDGFVETWYDQSGTVPPNDAVQATAGSQPKIVNAGSLLADGLTFDGSDDVLFTSSAINSTNTAIACVSKSGNNGTAGIISMLDGINDGHELLYLANTIRLATNNDDLNVTATITNQNLYFANYDGSTQTVSVNGTASTGSSSRTISVTQVAQIGSRRGSNFLNGSIEELIVYTSDESANRTALETNILSHYGIS